MELISSITDLDNVFSGPSATPQWDIGLQSTEEVEVTDRFVGYAAIFLAISTFLSLLWFQRIP